MTVKYTQHVANQRGFGSFTKLLLRWRGSVYKSVWQDMVIYLVLYYLISFIYRFGLTDPQRGIFESLVQSCSRVRNLIPISFVLGFYVSLVVNRWWGTYKSFPWPDTTAVLLATHIQGHDAHAKEIRSTILRYINLTITITYSMVSPCIKKKYNKWEDFIMDGYLTEPEMEIIRDLETRVKTHKTWLPIMWATKIAEKARQDGRILSDAVLNNVIIEINNVRSKCGEILGWNDHNIPLVYTQVVTIAVYSFFCSSLIGEQYLDPERKIDGHTIDLYVPMFALLQLFFYLGWVKVAEALLNPFGDDDHDFEFIPILKRNWEMSKILGEPQQSEIPPAVRNMGHSIKAENQDNQNISLLLIPKSKSSDSFAYIDGNV